MAQAHIYPYRIPSVHEKHPNSPNQLAGLRLDRSIEVGDAVDPQHLVRADATSRLLQAIHDSGENAAITPEMVRTAEARALSVANAHAYTEFGPNNLMQALQAIDQRLANIEGSLTALPRIEAGIDNLRRLSKNTRLVPPQRLVPLRKINRGAGRNLALPLLNVLSPVNRDIFVNQRVPPNIVAAAVGTLPPQFIDQIEAYQHIDILDLVVFYNDNFGIVANDNLADRIEKFRSFLTRF